MSVSWRSLAAALALPFAMKAQALSGAAKWADSARREIDTAVPAEDVSRLKAAMVLLDRALVVFPDDALLLHYQGYANYRMMNIAMVANAPDAPMFLRQAKIYLEKSLNRKSIPESWILLTSVYGRMIGIDPSSAMELGMEIQKASSTAFALDPKNPRVSLLQGQGALFSPPEYGGGAENAEKALARAVQLYETDRPAAPYPSWGRAEAYAWLGQVYERLNRKTEAKAAYMKALEIEPSYAWVRKALLPAVEKSGAE